MAIEEKIAPFKEFPPQPYIDRGPELPQHYGDDKLVAMVRDPFWIFFYWELEGPLGLEARSQKDWALRVHSLLEGTSYLVPIQAWTRNWYLEVAPAKRYRTEIGYLDASGKFRIIASSMEVETPSSGASSDLTEIWAHFFKDFSRGRLLRRRRAPRRPRPLPTIEVPGLSPGFQPPPASPQLQRKEYIFAL